MNNPYGIGVVHLYICKNCDVGWSASDKKECWICEGIDNIETMVCSYTSGISLVRTFEYDEFNVFPAVQNMAEVTEDELEQEIGTLFR